MPCKVLGESRRVLGLNKGHALMFAPTRDNAVNRGQNSLPEHMDTQYCHSRACDSNNYGRCTRPFNVVEQMKLHAGGVLSIRANNGTINPKEPRQWNGAAAVCCSCAQPNGEVNLNFSIQPHTKDNFDRSSAYHSGNSTGKLQ